jgi:hypothetical protein
VQCRGRIGQNPTVRTFVSRLYARSPRKRAGAPGLLRGGDDQQAIGGDAGALAVDHLDARQAGTGGMVADLLRGPALGEVVGLVDRAPATEPV